MNFGRRACVLHPIDVVSCIASGHWAKKPMIFGFVHGIRVLKHLYAGCFQVGLTLDFGPTGALSQAPRVRLVVP